MEKSSCGRRATDGVLQMENCFTVSTENDGRNEKDQL